MCKGEDEPGGPYRCPKDMRDRMIAAHAKLAAAVEKRDAIRARYNAALAAQGRSSGGQGATH